MTITAININRRKRIILVVILALLWIFVRQQIRQMDERFFQPSFSGIKGLALYMIGDYSGAAKAYRAHIQEAYQTERTAASSGLDALLRGDFQAAEDISKMALEKDPKATEPLLTLGEVALETSRFDNAKDFFERILQQEPDHFEALLLSSVTLARSGAYDKAIDILNHALRTNKIEMHPTAFLQALRITGDLTQLPKKAKPLCLLAHYYRYLRIFDPSNGRIAVGYAKKAIAAGNRPDDAFLTMGIIFYKEGKKEKALNAFRNAINANSKNPEAFRWAAIVYSDRGDLPSEYQMRNTAYLVAEKDNFYAIDLSIFLSSKLGDYHQALAISKRSLEISPNSVIALQRVAELYSLIGDPGQSIEYYRKALMLASGDPVLHRGLASGLSELGKNDEAISEFQRALSMSPYEPSIYINLALIYRKEQRFEEAINEYKNAFQLGERNIGYVVDLCALYHRVGKFQQAADCFKQVLAEDSTNRVANHFLPYTLKNLSQEAPR